MIDDARLKQWFCQEVLPLEQGLTRFVRRNWRTADDIADIRQEVYELCLRGAQGELPRHTSAYVYAVARNLLINRARRARIVSFELISDLENAIVDQDLLANERQLDARDQLRRTQAGLEQLPPRCREVVRLRKVHGLTTREVAERLDIGVDTVERQLVLGMRALVDFMHGGSGKIVRLKFPGARKQRTGK